MKIAGTYRPTGVTDELLEIIKKVHKEITGEDEVPPETIILTDKMTEEEKEFEMMNRLLMQGYSVEEAKKEIERTKKNIEIGRRLIEEMKKGKNLKN